MSAVNHSDPIHVERVWFGHYQMIEEIIQGPRTIVARATDRDETREVVIKGFLKSASSLVRYEREKRILEMLKLDCVSELIEAFESDHHYVLVFPYYTEDTLLEIKVDDTQLMQSRKHVTYILRVLLALCRAVNDLHQAGIVHLDLKPENVLIASGVDNQSPLPDGWPSGETNNAVTNPKVILIDFDLAACLSGEECGPKKEVCGTLGFIAPEILLTIDPHGSPTTKAIDYRKADIYAIGVIAYYLFNKEEYPYPIENHSEAVYAFRYQGPRPSHYARNRFINRFIMDMISLNPNDRPSLDQAVERLEAIIARV